MANGIKVSEDGALSPTEKETVVRFAKTDDRMTVHSEAASVVRWLYGHPDYEETNRRVKGGEVKATTGTLPVGCLKLSGTAREKSTPSSVTGKIPDDE